MVQKLTQGRPEGLSAVQAEPTGAHLYLEVLVLGHHTRLPQVKLGLWKHIKNNTVENFFNIYICNYLINNYYYYNKKNYMKFEFLKSA